MSASIDQSQRPLITPSIVPSSHPKSGSNLTPPSHVAPLPVLLVGHGSRDAQGRQAVLDLATAYAQLDPQRPVIPCFLELTTPTIADGVTACLEQGHSEVIALPVLLFGARHNKFDITNELDRLQQLHPELTIHYGAPIGITADILALLRDRLTQLDASLPQIPKEDTILLFVGRGSSDPEANSEACKLARLLWEGSGYRSVETCFVGITHPRLEEGFDRALLLKPKRIIVVPYFLFTGVLVKKILNASDIRNTAHEDVDIQCLPELGIVDGVLAGLYQREREAQNGEVRMNCQLCKFRLAADASGSLHNHSHHHGHDASPHNHHSHGHHSHGHHSHGHHSHGQEPVVDPYQVPTDYHQRVWSIP